MRLEAAVHTHVGLLRENNEDNFFLNGTLRQNLQQKTAQLHHRGSDKSALFAVADGMGGEENGELAALVTVQNLRGCSIAEVRRQSQQSIGTTNALICDEIRSSGRRMGSTLAALYIDGRSAICCNVGDSRVYLFRQDRLEQLSIDHTQVQQMVRSGLITPQEARTHKRRHVLTQNIGIFPEEMELEPAYSRTVRLQAGDLFLLCSDGLTDMADDERIAAVLRDGGTPEFMAGKLVQLALELGGRDNVTVLLVRVCRKSFLFSR